MRAPLEDGKLDIKIYIALLAAAALFALLAGCSGGGQSINDAAADMNVAANDTSASASPFAGAERKMNDAMMSAVGSDAGQNWAKKMLLSDPIGRDRTD